MGTTHFADQRRSPRVHEAIPIHYAIASEDYRVEHETTTLDRSSTGLKIRTADPLSRGETVIVMSQSGSPSAIPTRVAWVHNPELSFAGAAGLEILSSLPK
ncbi:MAG TPA: PilZ domain-containing protein [Terriglobia bacterium]|nr:PilZ domain-containing protein [Terriglobia bacterium]